jgi:hypothetical protein
MKNNLNTLLIKKERKNEIFSFNAFESVLKKCKFINNIIIKDNDLSTEEILNLIIKNCDNLKSIAFNFETISYELIEKFGLKFGQKLREISFNGDYESNDNKIKYKKLLRLCPNLVLVNGGYVKDLSLIVDNNELLVPKLSTIDTIVLSEDIELFETFAKSCGNSLKSASIATDFDVNENESNLLIKQIIYLKNLNHLELLLIFGENSNQEFIENLKSIAIHCNQLKNFKFRAFGTNSLLNKQVFNCLGLFKNLNVLHLLIRKVGKENNEISCESLKELKLLTHLRTFFPKMNDIFFEDIDKHLPQLKHLDIRVDNKITDKAMNSLSKLSKLQSIKINCYEDIVEETKYILPLITDIGLLDVINNCPQINLIVFNSRPNISHKTIDALIALALRKPRIQFDLYFTDIEKECICEDITFTAIDLKGFQFPNNLVIE